MTESRIVIADRAAMEAADAVEPVLKNTISDRESLDEDTVEEILEVLYHDVENTINGQLKRAEAEHYGHDF